MKENIVYIWSHLCCCVKESPTELTGNDEWAGAAYLMS